jgi:predicted secreted protein
LSPAASPSRTTAVRGAALLAALLCHPVAQAQTSTPVLAMAPQNVVNLSAQASAEVAQDLLSISLQLLREGSDAAQVQQQLRLQLDAAVTEARKAVRPGQLEVRTGSFNVSPRYASRANGAAVIAGWQGQAELILEGRDMPAISALAGRLPGLSVQRVQAGLSREAREQVEGQVTAQALDRFKVRAEAMARQLGFASYSLRELTVGSADAAGPVPQPMFRLARGVAVAAEDASQPVAVGQTTVTVSVTGSVQLSPR